MENHWTENRWVLLGTFTVIGFALLVITIVLVDRLVKLKCHKCNIRIASIKMANTYKAPYQDASSAELYVGKYICSVCWEVLKETGLNVEGTWLFGATVEYLKNTPNSLAVLISIGAFIVAIVSLTLN